jgi:hypothetical protein
MPMKRKLIFAVAGLALLAGGTLVGRAQQAGPSPFPGVPGAFVLPEDQKPVDPDMNRDIEVTPAQGAWMVLVTSYSGPDAPTMARQMVTVLRGPKYNQPAYVFNYGDKERRKEEERERAAKEQQQRLLEQMKQQFGDNVSFGKYTIARHHVQQQVGVLIGGYADMDAAHRALEGIRKLDPKALVDPTGLNGVKLDRRIFIKPDGKSGEARPVNPFQTAFVVRNPTAPQQANPQAEKFDLAVLRRLNQGESYSLLNCTKPITLVVAQYSLPAPLEKRGKDNSILGKLHASNNQQSDVDPAAVPAHCLAEWLRKGNIEAYVLHTKYASIVTVGSYDSLRDPRMETMKKRWVDCHISQRFNMLNLFPQPVPMPVPR